MVGEETTSFPEFCPTRGGHGVGGVRGGWYMNLGAQSLNFSCAVEQNEDHSKKSSLMNVFVLKKWLIFLIALKYIFLW